MSDRYFCYDPEDGFNYFATQEEATEWADKQAREYLDVYDFWPEDEVRQIVVGIVTHVATKCDVELREDQDEEELESWNDDWQFKCNYRMLPKQTKEAQGE